MEIVIKENKLGGYNRIWWQLIQHLFSENLVFYVSIILLTIVIASYQLVKFGYQPLQLLSILLSLSNFTRLVLIMRGDANEDAKHLFTVNIEFFVIFSFYSSIYNT